jgi:hypothetical protein
MSTRMKREKEEPIQSRKKIQRTWMNGPFGHFLDVTAS